MLVVVAMLREGLGECGKVDFVPCEEIVNLLQLFHLEKVFIADIADGRVVAELHFNLVS